MDETPKKSRWQRSWVFPASALLHVLIAGAFYLQWPQATQAPAEPESVNVDLVEPPKEKPPAPPEEKKAEEPPPPQAKEKEPPPPPPPPTSSAVVNAAIRNDKTQLDERDESGEVKEEGGQKQQEPAEGQNASPQDAAPQYAAVPDKSAAKPEDVPKDVPEQAKDTSSPPPPVAEDGELPAAEKPQEEETAAVAVPAPKPTIDQKPAPSEDAPPSGSGNPELKPARKILAAGKPPGPMMRQIYGNLSPRDRVRQLCYAEVLQQIAAERKGQAPVEGIIYAKRQSSGNVEDANGAFNVGTDWFPLTYNCTVDIDRYVVTEFRYDIRPKLPAEEAKRRGFRIQ